MPRGGALGSNSMRCTTDRSRCTRTDERCAHAPAGSMAAAAARATTFRSVARAFTPTTLIVFATVRPALPLTASLGAAERSLTHAFRRLACIYLNVDLI